MDLVWTLVYHLGRKNNVDDDPQHWVNFYVKQDGISNII